VPRGPFYVLGHAPSPTFDAGLTDHITSGIGATMAGTAGAADAMLRDAERATRLTTADDVKAGAIAYKIAAQAAASRGQRPGRERLGTMRSACAR